MRLSDSGVGTDSGPASVPSGPGSTDLTRRPAVFGSPVGASGALLLGYATVLSRPFTDPEGLELVVTLRHRLKPARGHAPMAVLGPLRQDSVSCHGILHGRYRRHRHRFGPSAPPAGEHQACPSAWPLLRSSEGRRDVTHQRAVPASCGVSLCPPTAARTSMTPIRKGSVAGASAACLTMSSSDTIPSTTSPMPRTGSR